MSRYLEALEAHREEIDSLNVFPVPDGDTGTNMLLTQRSVEDACRDADGSPLADLGEAISRAALMGARGNSGVILSQILRGFCGRLCAGEEPDGSDLAEALTLADQEARRAVARPVEGTILSVLREAAAAARETAERESDTGDVARAALEAAGESLERTREQLPELRAAGVVDAGAKGLVLFFDALVSAITGEPLSVEVGPPGPISRPEGVVQVESRYGYEVMYLIECPEDAVRQLREALDSLGDSVVVVGGGGLYNAHVHTDDPGAAVEVGIRLAPPRNIRITSLDQQVSEACLATQVRQVRLGETEPPGEETGQSVVAVADGDGLQDLFLSLGALVVPGGPGDNPSVQELVEAIERAPGRVVHLLPNHENIVPAARAAALESGKDVEVVPTRSFPAGLAAALAFSPDDAAEANHEGMEAAAASTGSGEVAYAERSADTPIGRVDRGDCLGTSHGEVRVRGRDPEEVAVALARALLAEHHEILTLYVGAGVPNGQADRVAGALRAALTDLDVEVHTGGQRYPYLIGLE